VPGDLRDVRKPHARTGVFIVALALGMAIGAGYEIVEWTLDATLDTGLQQSKQDTGVDLVADTAGAAAAGALLVVWSRFGWGTIRRTPARAVR
jgi:uncharacterized membrane protein YjdF